MKIKSIILRLFIIPAMVFAVAACVSCKIPGNWTGESKNEESTGTGQAEKTEGYNNKSSGGVISLLDSIGVGDVPMYPGSKHGGGLNEALGEYRNQIDMPAEFLNVLYSVYTTRHSPAEVISYFNQKMEELGWKKDGSVPPGNSGFMVWKKLSNYGKDVSYIIASAEITYGGNNVVVILTGMIIPERDGSIGDYTETTVEGQEIGPGDIYFVNPTPPAGAGLLQSKPFSMGIDEWKIWLQGGSGTEGNNKVYLRADPIFGKVVEFYRDSNPDDGGAAGIYQETAIDLAGYNSLKVWLTGKILKENGGNIANVNPPDFPEGAVIARIKYITEDNIKKECYHGFFYSNIIYYDRLHYSLVIKDNQFWYISPDLMELYEKPAKITEIRVYGFGWDFKGQAAEINIIGS